MSKVDRSNRSQLGRGLPLLGGSKIAKLYPAACGILALFAFGFNWVTGHRGVFFLDQSMIFDGAWRLLQGEMPYRDFVFPFGPTTFYIQAAFFWLFGVDWSATVLSACAVNTVATLSAIRTAHLLTRGDYSLALFCGLLTAVSFQAPFGTLWFEQTAMFFNLLALQAVVESGHKSGGARPVLLFAGGVSLTIAILSKQNFGVFFVPVAIAILVAGELPDVGKIRRALLFLGAGAATCAGVFVLWLWLWSDATRFVQHVLVVAGEIGKSRLTWQVIGRALCFDVSPRWLQVDTVGVFAAVLLIARAKRLGKAVVLELAPIGLAAVLLTWYRSFTQATTYNEWENNVAFTGLSFCLALAVLRRLAGGTLPQGSPPLNDPARTAISPRAATALLALAWAWGVFFLFYEGTAAWKRRVQQFTYAAKFHQSVGVRGLERVQWGEPTVQQSGSVLEKAGFQDLAAYLGAKGERFFVMGDATILYALLGVRSPQPLLYFLRQHSFVDSEIPELDAEILAALDRSEIKVVVREKTTYLDAVRDSYPRFPRMWAWFHRHFMHVRDFGNYELWERRGDREL